MSTFDEQTLPLGEENAARIAQFEESWRNGDVPKIEDYLPAADDESFLAALEALVGVELHQLWNRDETGDASLLGPYLQRFPALSEKVVLVRLIHTEIRVRRENGHPPDPDFYVQQFPALDDEDLFDPTCDEETLINGESGSRVVPLVTDRIGEYELLDQLGVGGMGVVYRALQPGANRVVALKVIRADNSAAMSEAARNQSRERFRNEAQAAAKLEHENIVPVYDVGQVDDLLYFSMRLVDGVSLKDLVESGPLENKRAAEYLLGTTRGVAEAHRLGILHRDLKPHNVMIDSRTDRPLVADFGLAKFAESGQEVTQTGETLGTPSYMAPEQISDSAGVDERSDVYSLGATLYQLLTGRPPFQAPNTLGTMRQVLYDDPAPPVQLNSAVDRDLETICVKCLQKEPSKRYTSAVELADDLQRYRNGEPIHARPVGRIERTIRWCRRNPTAATASAAAMVLAGIALTAVIVGYRETTAALAVSERNLTLAREAVDELYTDVSEIDLKDMPGMQPLKQKLLRRALTYYQKILEERGDDAELTSEIAQNHFRVGLITEEIESTEAALPHFEQALSIQQKLLDTGSSDLQLLEDLSDSWNAIGRIRHRFEEFSEAEAAYDFAHEHRRQLVDAAPLNREYARKLANIVMNMGLLDVRHGDGAAAAEHYQEAQQMRKRLLDLHYDEPVARDYARGAFNQGTLQASASEFALAADNFETAAVWFDRLLAEQPESLSLRFDLAVAHQMRGDALQFLDTPESALDDFHRAGTNLRQLGKQNPSVLAYQEQLATALIGQGQLQLRLAFPDEQAETSTEQTQAASNASQALKQAQLAFLEAETVLGKVVLRDHERISPRFNLSVVRQVLGEIEYASGNSQAATDYWRAAQSALEPVRGNFDRHPGCAEQWALLEESLQAVQEPETPREE